MEMAIDPTKYNWNTNYNKNDKFTDEERKANSAKSGEIRRRRRKFREIFEELLSLTNSEGEGIDELISIGLIRKALEGDMQAFQLIRDQLNEKPKDQLELSTDNVIEINIISSEEPEEEHNSEL
jgi:hypothetical protein